jgi:hypothetical protein
MVQIWYTEKNQQLIKKSGDFLMEKLIDKSS